MGSVVFFLGAFVFFFLFFQVIRTFFNSFSNDDFIYKLEVVVLSGVYLLLSLMSFFWFFDVLKFELAEFNFIFSFLLLSQTILIYFIVSKRDGNRKISYLLLFYLVSLFYLFFSFQIFLVLLSSVSFFLMFLLAIYFLRSNENSLSLAIFTLAYSILGLVSVFFDHYSLNESYMVKVALSVILLLFFGSIFKKVRSRNVLGPRKKRSNLLLVFARYFLFVLVLANLSLIGTIGFHETSHAIAANYYGCDYKVILYEVSDYPKTEVLCNQDYQKFNITLAGPLFTALLAVLLFVVGGPITREVSILMFGFNLIASSRDLMFIGLGESISFFSMSVGVICLGLGIFYLAHHRIFMDSYLNSNS